jgi:hypothetical protein
MKELKYPLNFFDKTEEMNYLTIESFLTAISDEEVLGGRMPSSLAECKKLLITELKEIVENALIRHLELWAESLDNYSDIEMNELGEFVCFDEETGGKKFYNGFVYVEENTNGNMYFSCPQEDAEEILYVKNGNILHNNLCDNVIQYLSEDKWYKMVHGHFTIIFNLTADNPVCFNIINNSPTKFKQPISLVSDMIFSGLIPSEITQIG